MKKQYDFTKIDFSDLRKQKRELLKVIKERNLPEGEDELDGIVHLIDSIQDFVCDELGYNEHQVFDCDIDDPDFHPTPLYAQEVVEAKLKTLSLCNYCHSDNVELKYWVNPNTKVLNNICDEPMGYCNDCGLPTTMYEVKLHHDANVIGFQVISDDDKCEIHPDMDGSFCLYSLSQANKMIETNTRKRKWRLLTIWSGDIEEPTMMFQGDPRL